MSRHQDVRYINTGHGTSITRMTVFEVAARRAENLTDPSQYEMFLNAFNRIRMSARRGSDLENLWRMVWGNDLLLSAYVEALASLRAEGHRV